MSSSKRLHIVIRADLDPGLGGAQAIHTTDEFRKRYPNEDTGDTVIFLEAESQLRLMQLALCAALDGIAVCPFYEPDLNGECTGVAFGNDAKKMLADLPKAFHNLKREKPAPKTISIVGKPTVGIADDEVTLDQDFILKKVAADLSSTNGYCHKAVQMAFLVGRRFA